MPTVHLHPAQSLIEDLTREELARFADSQRLDPSGCRSKKQLVSMITRQFDLDEITCSLLAFFPKRRATGGKKPPGEVRLDRVPRLHGNLAVHVYSRTNPRLGRLLIEHDGSCIQLRLSNVQLFLDIRWPVIAADAGPVPTRYLYAGFVGSRRIHAAAEMPPPKERPFIIDEGECGFRNGRLRLELKRSGPGSFRVDFLRFGPRNGRPEYLLQPIA